MADRTVFDWTRILKDMGVIPATASRWAPIFADVIKPGTFNLGDAELGNFLGQVLHESCLLERLVENLNYSVERLMAVWPSRFPTRDVAQPYARNPAKLAEKVYGGRLGNDEPGDGARYIGRGLIQVTGKDNYRSVGKALGLDLVRFPDLLADPRTALLASITWWESHVPNSAIGDIAKITKAVNGGAIGLAERKTLTDEAQKALG